MAAADARGLESGDEIGVRDRDRRRWVPFRFERADERGRHFFAPVLPWQPRICLWTTTHGSGALEWRFASEDGVTFVQPCPTCSVKMTVREKGEAVAHEDYSWVRGPRASKDCATCDGASVVAWEPFAVQPVGTLLMELVGV